MKDSRETLKQKYKAGEISINEFKAGLQEIEAKDRECRDQLLESLEDPQAKKPEWQESMMRTFLGSRK